MADRPPEQEPTPNPAESLFSTGWELMTTYPEHCFANRSGSISILAAQNGDGRQFLLVGTHERGSYREPPQDLCVYPLAEGAIENGICVVGSKPDAIAYVDETGMPYTGERQTDGFTRAAMWDMARQEAEQLEAATPAPLTPEVVRLIIGRIDSGPYGAALS